MAPAGPTSSREAPARCFRTGPAEHRFAVAETNERRGDAAAYRSGDPRDHRLRHRLHRSLAVRRRGRAGSVVADLVLPGQLRQPYAQIVVVTACRHAPEWFHARHRSLAD